MQNNIQFAVVREDPRIFINEISERNMKKVLMLASGGCTALSYKSVHPNLDITLFDMNLYQINHVKDKIYNLYKYNSLDTNEFNSIFNIEHNKNFYSLNANGNFESLFQQLMSFVFEFLITKKDLENLIFSSNISDDKFDIIFSNKYWKTAFELFFSDELLITMFGVDAVQHAEKNSYPKYFQKVFEDSMLKEDRNENYFLHHILFGHYYKGQTPLYLSSIPSNLKFNFIHGSFFDIENISDYDMIDLSNIFDWMDISEVKNIIESLKFHMKKDAVIVFRQINNYTDIISLFGEEFTFNKGKCNRLREESQSMFYNQINLGIKG